MNYDRLCELDTIPLSNDAFVNSLGIDEEDILKYSELSKYKTIDELLPNNGDFKIVFLDWGSAVGHWVICYKQNNKYCYSNSFGNAPDKDLNVLTRCMKRILGENVAQFERLLGKNKIYHSKYRLQGKNSNSCGRYVISRIQCLKLNMDNKEYHEYLDGLRNKYDLSYDLVVCLLVPIPREKVDIF